MNLIEPILAQAASITQLRRDIHAHPSEFAAAVALLASDQGGFFVGATLDMNGGLFMR